MKTRVIFKEEDGKVYLARIRYNDERAVELTKEMNEKEKADKYLRKMSLITSSNEILLKKY